MKRSLKLEFGRCADEVVVERGILALLGVEGWELRLQSSSAQQQVFISVQGKERSGRGFGAIRDWSFPKAEILPLMDKLLPHRTTARSGLAPERPFLSPSPVRTHRAPNVEKRSCSR